MAMAGQMSMTILNLNHLNGLIQIMMDMVIAQKELVLMLASMNTETHMQIGMVALIQTAMVIQIQMIHGIRGMVLTPSRTMIPNGLILMEMDLEITGAIVLGQTVLIIGLVFLLTGFRDYSKMHALFNQEIQLKMV